jgi:hypothetical protein
VEIDAYRLWQQWQAMHYPRRGVPDGPARSIDLVALDGTAGAVLERYFCRGPHAKVLDAQSLAALESCHRELGQVNGLVLDARRYFSRLSQLIELVLADRPPRGSDEQARRG